MKLQTLVSRVSCEILQGGLDLEITDIAYDSRNAADGCVFVCLTGAAADGHDFIGSAVEKGAVAVIIERDVPMADGVTYIKTDDTRRALALMSCVFFGDPSHELNVIGITGTKGKTTTAYMIKRVLESCGQKTGLIGTIETIVGDGREKAKNTTPESYELQKLLRRMADADCRYAVAEVSSQGLKMHRVLGTRFPLGIYTNLSRDHIGEHEHADMAEYTACKSIFFRMCETALINADCPSWHEVLQDSTCKRLFYGVGERNNVAAVDIENMRRGERLCVDFTLKGSGKAVRCAVGLPGRHSVHNALAAFGTAEFFGLSAQADALVDIKVPGRAQLAAEGLPFTVLIDYAHNELSMESLMRSLREYEPNRLLCLFGCGGNRDRARRLSMGEMAGRYADLSILTEDNPRFENVIDIVADILTGLEPTGGKYEIVSDRRDAIFHMLDIAQPGDICAIIGKGHEDYQEIEGKKYPFVEADIVAEWARNFGRTGGSFSQISIKTDKT